MLKHRWINLAIFWVESAILLLRHSDNLSTTLQNRKLCFSSSIDSSRNFYHLRKTTRPWLLFAVMERSFNWVEPIKYWWAHLRKKKESVPTNRKCYSRSPIGFFHEKFEDFSRQIHFKVLDLLINVIKNRFIQGD